MITDIGSGDSGWSEYVLGKLFDRDHAKLIVGDTVLGDKICHSTNYSNGQYIRIVASFLDGLPLKKSREIAKEFVSLLMHGFHKDEYHHDMVEHTDTEYTHYHIRISKLNLVTGTQLKIYWHKADLERKTAIMDYLCEKYGLTHALDRKQLNVSPQKKVEHINRWRKEHGQDPFILSTKKGRGQAEEQINDYINVMNLEGLINSLDDVQSELTAMGFEIVKIDRDKGKDFDYITVQNKTGKIRLKGDIYGTGFYQYNSADRKKAIGDNRSLDKGRGSLRPSLGELQRKLDKENAKRLKWVTNRYSRSRERAIQRAKERVGNLTTKLHKNEKNATVLSYPYSSNIGDSDRSVGNSPTPQLKLNTGYQLISNNRGTERESLVSSDDRGSKENKRTRGIDERDRTEVIRRVSKLRKAKRKRADLIRGELERHSQELDYLIPRVDDGDIQSHIDRSNKIDRAIGKLNDTTTADFECIKREVISSTNERAVGQDFDAIIYRIKTGIGVLIGELEQEFNIRTQNLIVGIANVVKKIKLFENRKKKVMSRLRSKKKNLSPRR